MCAHAGKRRNLLSVFLISVLKIQYVKSRMEEPGVVIVQQDSREMKQNVKVSRNSIILNYLFTFKLFNYFDTVLVDTVWKLKPNWKTLFFFIYPEYIEKIVYYICVEGEGWDVFCQMTCTLFWPPCGFNANKLCWHPIISYVCSLCSNHVIDLLWQSPIMIRIYIKSDCISQSICY